MGRAASLISEFGNLEIIEATNVSKPHLHEDVTASRPGGVVRPFPWLDIVRMERRCADGVARGVSERVGVLAIGAAVLLRPTKSPSLHLQQVGRSPSPASENNQPNIPARTGNVLRHGLAGEPCWIAQKNDKPDHQVPRRIARSAVITPVPHCSNSSTPPPFAGGMYICIKLIGELGLCELLPAMSYVEVFARAGTAERARMIVLVRNSRLGWAWYRARVLEERAPQ